MAVSDKIFGGAMLLVAAVVFVYYTIWAILLPLLDESNPLHGFFPPREWAVRLPAFILIVGLSIVGIFIGVTMSKEKRKEAEKAKRRTA